MWPRGAVMSHGREGNRKSGAALAMRYKTISYTYIGLKAYSTGRVMGTQLSLLMEHIYIFYNTLLMSLYDTPCLLVYDYYHSLNSRTEGQCDVQIQADFTTNNSFTQYLLSGIYLNRSKDVTPATGKVTAGLTVSAAGTRC